MMAKTVDMFRSPSLLERLERDANESVGLPNDIGALVRVLAASKVGAIAMQLGIGNSEVAAWLLDGMDITSRLIMLIGPEVMPAQVGIDQNEDIRVAIHCQTAMEFMEDIKAHRFHLIVYDTLPSSNEELATAIGLLDEGGIVILLNSGPEIRWTDVLTWLSSDRRMHSANVMNMGKVIFSVRRPHQMKTIRRGARRARIKRAQQQ
tara:strand:- start:50 stop:667 length:618 start_codon:yes stop_codon:yes gene_type:complete